MTATTTAPTLAELSRNTGQDRNRAIDVYRAVAMLAVAIGHWLAISVFVDDDGAIQAGDALDLAPQFAPISWLLQVMPLFFVVGGFASAASLDAHARRGDATSADWVSARLRRLFAPVAVLGSFWLAVIGLATPLGWFDLAVLAASAGAIPLWFIANYAIDTAIAPLTLPAFRRSPKTFSVGLVGVIAALELLRYSEPGGWLGLVPHLNWILGWLGFQVAGFAWRDGLINPGRSLAAAGTVALGVATALVTAGPYPVSMVHFDGVGHLSPTHPPSLALLFFGAGYSALAVAAAPMIDRLLDARPALWTATVAANGIAMSVYLWHFTAAAAAGAILLPFDLLPTATTGTSLWWLQKVPLLLAATVVLVGIVAVVARFEQRALFAERVPTRFSYPTLLAFTAAMSAAVKLAWTSQTAPGIVIGSLVVVAGYHVVLAHPGGRGKSAAASRISRY